MIEKFQQRFSEEARENCDRLEQYLLELEQDIHHEGRVDEIFRIMHSLKGSGGMFGFSLLSEFTHELESLYQLVREGHLSLDSRIISFTLRCIDVIRNLLSPVIPEEVRALVAGLKSEAQRLMDHHPADAMNLAGYLAKTQDEVKQKKTWYIFFEPDENIFNNGTNPLYLVDELNTLGDCQIEADLKKVPLPDLLQVEKCYTLWRAILTTNEDLSEIEDLFLFVRDHSRIEILEIPESVISSEDLLRKFLKEDPEEVAKQIKELQEIRIETPAPAAELKATPESAAPSTIRVDSSRVDDYMNLVSELITAQSRLFLMAEERKDKELTALAEHFDKLTHQMRDNAFDMNLVPLYSIVTRFRRLVRDLSVELKKEVNLELHGLETEVDKNVIEKLVNPMIHLVRNCVDHGIEGPEERLSKGKTKAGTVALTAGYEGNSVLIRIEDDGRGIDFDRIWAKAVEKGLVNESDPKNEEGLLQIIFNPGFTTSEQLTDVSGRGIGLDAAKKTIQDLRGEITVETKAGKGTCFMIRVPLTLSIIDGMLIRIDQDIYIIPTSYVQKIYPLIHEGEEAGVMQVKTFEGQQIPYLDLGKEFYGTPGQVSPQYLITVNHKDRLFGLAVDDIMREYQAVVKPVGKLAQNGHIFMGASILGDGRAALVLDVQTIIQKFLQ